jgi:hypothetical protein
MNLFYLHLSALLAAIAVAAPSKKLLSVRRLMFTSQETRRWLSEGVGLAHNVALLIVPREFQAEL